MVLTKAEARGFDWMLVCMVVEAKMKLPFTVEKINPNDRVNVV